MAILLHLLGCLGCVATALTAILKEETFLFPAGPLSLAPLLISELLCKIVYPSLSDGIWSVPLLGLGQSVSVRKQHVMCFLRKTVEWN